MGIPKILEKKKNYDIYEYRGFFGTVEKSRVLDNILIGRVLNIDNRYWIEYHGNDLNDILYRFSTLVDYYILTYNKVNHIEWHKDIEQDFNNNYLFKPSVNYIQLPFCEMPERQIDKHLIDNFVKQREQQFKENIKKQKDENSKSSSFDEFIYEYHKKENDRIALWELCIFDDIFTGQSLAHNKKVLDEDIIGSFRVIYNKISKNRYECFLAGIRENVWVGGKSKKEVNEKIKAAIEVYNEFIELTSYKFLNLQGDDQIKDLGASFEHKLRWSENRNLKVGDCVFVTPQDELYLLIGKSKKVGKFIRLTNGIVIERKGFKASVTMEKDFIEISPIYINDNILSIEDLIYAKTKKDALIQLDNSINNRIAFMKSIHRKYGLLLKKLNSTKH